MTLALAVRLVVMDRVLITMMMMIMIVTVQER